MLSVPGRPWTWTWWSKHFQMNSLVFLWQTFLSQGKPVCHFLLYCCVSPPCPLPQFFVANTHSGPCLFSLSCSATCPAPRLAVMTADGAFLAKWSWHSVAHCLWGHTAVPIAAPIGHSSTAVRGFPSCPIEKEGPKGFSEHQFRGPATSQTIRDYSTAPIHFPLLLPHRYPQEKTNLQKNSPCQLTSPPKCMMIPNSCLRGYLFS